jgi:glycylpeptide N-tetradecanoyltransferase
LNQYLAKWRTHIIYTQEEVEYYFMPRDNVIHSYVVEDEKTITDFYSFYSLPSSILKHDTHKLLRVAYSYYNVSTSNNLKQGIEDVLIMARDLGYDVYNALDVMENS